MQQKEIKRILRDIIDVINYTTFSSSGDVLYVASNTYNLNMVPERFRKYAITIDQLNLTTVKGYGTVEFTNQAMIYLLELGLSINGLEETPRDKNHELQLICNRLEELGCDANIYNDDGDLIM